MQTYLALSNFTYFYVNNSFLSYYYPFSDFFIQCLEKYKCANFQW